MVTLTGFTWNIAPRSDGKLYTADYWTYNLQLSQNSTAVLGTFDNSPHPDVDHYKLYRSTDNITYVERGDLFPSASTTSFTDSSVVAGTTYYYRVAAVDASDNIIESPWLRSGEPDRSIAFTGSVFWSQEPDIVFTQGVAGQYDLDDDVSNPAIVQLYGIEAGALPTGVTLTGARNNLVTYDGVGAKVNQSATFYFEDDAAEVDWQTRISGTGVVWYHDFRSAAEVDNFRWSGGVGNGNDPGAVRLPTDSVAWNPTGGLTGSGCLSMHRDAGNSEGSIWSRPFSALVGTGNGRGEDDPAANDTITVRPYTSTQGGDQLSSFNYGWWGHSDYHDSTFEGDEFWLQFRVKRDLNRGSSPSVGKFLNLGVSGSPPPQSQTLVTYSELPRFRCYAYWGGTGATPLNQQGTPQDGTVQPGGVPEEWEFTGNWDCVMYHIIPGHEDVQDTTFEVYVATEGETSFTLIWSGTYLVSHFLDKRGWQGLAVSTYQNGQTGAEWTDLFDQFIFSTESIPCPQV